MLVSWATKWIYVFWPKNYHIPKFGVQKWARPIKNGVKDDRKARTNAEMEAEAKALKSILDQ